MNILFKFAFLKRFLVLFAVLFLNATILAPELRITRFDQNDNVLHWMIIQDMAQAKNPFDFWSPEIAYGQPIARLYQPGAHLMVVGTWNLLGRHVPLKDIFIWFRYLSFALLPLSFFFCARLLGFSIEQATAAAAVSWLISGDTWGLDFGSYAWAGHGLFPQAVATHFLLLTIGFGWRAIRGQYAKGRRGYWIIPAVLLVICGWTNLLYGYVASMTLLLIAAIPDWGWKRQFSALAKVAAVGGICAAPKLFSWWQDRSLIGSMTAGAPTRDWMYNGLGAGTVMKQLLLGDTLDHGRLPVLTLLAFAGVALMFWRRDPLRVFLLSGFIFWLQVSFGSAFWGPLIKLVGVTSSFQIHRLVGAVDVFLVLIAGACMATGFGYLRGRFGLAAALATCAVFLEPAIQDRMTRMQTNAEAGDLNLQAGTLYASSVQEVIAYVRERGGRAYAGSFGRGTPPGWGNQVSVGYVPIYASLTANQVPNVGFFYIGMLRANALIYKFDDQSPRDYVDYNVKSVIANSTWAPPAFLSLSKVIGEFSIYSAPGAGYFEGSIEESDHAGEYRGNVRRDSFGPVLLRAVYHRNWHATVDDQPVPVRMAANGFMNIEVPQGQHEILVRYR